MVRNSLLPNGMRVKENFSNSTRSASAVVSSITNLSTNTLDINTGAVAGVEGINVGGTTRGGTGQSDYWVVDINPINTPDATNSLQPISLVRLRDRGSATNSYTLIQENSAGGQYPLVINRDGQLRMGGSVPLTTAISSTAMIELVSTTQGLRFPNMTTAQKNAISNTAGLVIFDTSLGKLCVNTGAGWQTITSA